MNTAADYLLQRVRPLECKTTPWIDVKTDQRTDVLPYARKSLLTTLPDAWRDHADERILDTHCINIGFPVNANGAPHDSLQLERYLIREDKRTGVVEQLTAFYEPMSAYKARQKNTQSPRQIVLNTWHVRGKNTAIVPPRKDEHIFRLITLAAEANNLMAGTAGPTCYALESLAAHSFLTLQAATPARPAARPTTECIDGVVVLLAMLQHRKKREQCRSA